MGRHRARPRYRRITVAGTAVLVTGVAVLGGIGILPTSSTPTPSASAAPAESVGFNSSASASLPLVPRVRSDSVDLPADSGNGKRIVFDMSNQRVWLVADKDKVRRSYLVSGSVTDNLGAGSYEVYSKSMDAVGVDDSGTMRYMVRFAHGPEAAIGFHDIPVLDGEKLQTRGALGTPQSHGCIRAWRPDAKALWDFAPLGTQVVVVA